MVFSRFNNRDSVPVKDSIPDERIGAYTLRLRKETVNQKYGGK
jgi:hypothetical protein